MRPTLLLTVICISVWCLAAPAPHVPGKHHHPWSDSLKMEKLIVKRDAVRLAPNPTYDGTVSVASNLTETLHFYIFDLDGTMVYQAVLKDKEQKKIDHLLKGTYTYDVFLNDESIEEGKIIVK